PPALKQLDRNRPHLHRNLTGAASDRAKKGLEYHLIREPARPRRGVRARVGLQPLSKYESRNCRYRLLEVRPALQNERDLRRAYTRDLVGARLCSQTRSTGGQQAKGLAARQARKYEASV